MSVACTECASMALAPADGASEVADVDGVDVDSVDVVDVRAAVEAGVCSVEGAVAPASD